MRIKNIFKYFANNRNYTKGLFISTFILYGIILSVILYSVSNHFQSEQTKSKILESQKESFAVKAEFLEDEINGFIHELEAIRDSSTFRKYVKTKNLNKSVKDIFNVVIQHNKQLSQIRFIDKNGFEKIRFERKALGGKSSEVLKDNLQNKVSRYYFKSIKNISKGEIWFSKLDLNMERGKIQIPIVPTLRIGTPIYEKGKFKGIIIINIFFENIIKSFVESPFFYITIYDKDGEFIYHKHPNNKGIMTDYSWSRYLRKGFNLNNHKKNFHAKGVKKFIFEKSIKKIIPNSDQLSVYFEPKMLKLKELEKNEKSYIITITLIVLATSIPLALIVSIIPNMLNKQLYEIKKLLEKEVKTVNDYVCLSITNTSGIIVNVSKAYEKLTGYSKDELIGSTHCILRNPKTPYKLYINLWQTILSKQIWEGEIENIKKDGSSYIAKTLIKPNLDKRGNIEGFTSFVQDITYQKKVEKVSVTDELTNLFNRREFNNVFEYQYTNSKRYNYAFCFIIMDIDFFKQYNDTYGHLEGDNVIKAVADTLRKVCQRDTDYLFRIGGEEFSILFPAKTQEEAYKFSEKIRRSIEELKIEHKNSKINKYVTVSLGLFFKKNLNDLEKNNIFVMCDKALYKSKENGRNRVSLA